MQKVFTLRPFSPEDLEEVMNINRICLPENYSPYFFMDLYERYPATFTIAKGSQGIMGYIMCRIERGFTSFVGFNLTKRAHLVSVAVLPEYQHKGVGTALLKNALKNMPQYGAKECFLEVRVSNTPAVEMYRKLGFLIVRRSRGYYADGEDANIMEKKLEKTKS